jgi:hypothetical protein
VTATFLLVMLQAFVWGWSGVAQADYQRYADAQGRFTFEYPTSFGAPTTGTDAGFQERAAAVRFAAINAEVVLTRGRVLVDHQAAGGLYDHFALQVFSDAMRSRIERALPPLTPDNFCAAIAAVDRAAGLGLPPDLTAAAGRADRMQFVSPRVDRCDRRGRVIGFSRTAATEMPSSPRTHVYGAVRFLDDGVSSFQIVARAADAPSSGTLDAMTRVVESLSPGR